MTHTIRYYRNYKIMSCYTVLWTANRFHTCFFRVKQNSSTHMSELRTFPDSGLSSWLPRAANFTFHIPGHCIHTHINIYILHQRHKVLTVVCDLYSSSRYGKITSIKTDSIYDMNWFFNPIQFSTDSRQCTVIIIRWLLLLPTLYTKSCKVTTIQQ